MTNLTWPKKAVFVFHGKEPQDNLAQEEALWELFPQDSEDFLWMILYVNKPCVVMGRHQNPLAEVRFEQLFCRKIPLLRRCTGGGTVWHDEGNVNVGFIMPKKSYCREKLLDFLLSTLTSIGFSLVATNKGDLLLDQHKVSGHAYAFGKNKVLHHGTVLCSAQLDDLRAILGSTRGLIHFLGVASRPMSVMNLAEKNLFAFDEILTHICHALIETFIARFNAVKITEDQLNTWDEWLVKKEELRQRLLSLSWIFDQTPPFTWICLKKETCWQVQVEQGKVISCIPCSQNNSAPFLQEFPFSIKPGSWFFHSWCNNRQENTYDQVYKT